MHYKWIVIAAFALVYLYRMVLSALSLAGKDRPLPANVADVYDRETYLQWKAYHTEKARLDMWRQTAAFAVELLLLAADAYAWFAGFFPDTLFMRMLGVLLLSALTDAALLPFEYYDVMRIEEKYGFNRSTKKTFWLDQLKNFLIGLIIMTAVGAILMGLHLWLGDGLIIVFAVVMTVLALGISFLYPYLSRVFNKFTPLPEGELREKLERLLTKNGYQVRAIQVMDASRRSSKSNAYFTGFGKMKTIVLYDTLVESLTPDEICAVFAHELGHGLNKDTLKRQLESFVMMLVLGVLAFFTVRTPELFRAFGFENVNYGFALILVMNVEFALVSPLFGLLTNGLSRRAEYRADRQAVREGCGEALISSLKKLARENFSDLSPHPLLVKLEYSHPTLSQRIDAIRKERG